MSGSELLKTLGMIDENARESTERVAAEMSRYIQKNQAQVVGQLRERQFASIPTSVGMIDLTLSEVQQAWNTQQTAAA